MGEAGQNGARDGMPSTLTAALGSSDFASDVLTRWHRTRLLIWVEKCKDGGNNHSHKLLCTVEP
jgi:hypothetical protein